MKASRIVVRVLSAGCLGVLVFLFVNTASNMMQSCGSSNFASWFGSKLHEKVIQFGDKRGSKAYRGPNGEDNWTMVAPHLKLKYYLGPGMMIGFVLGAAVGGALVGWEWRRKAGAAASAAAAAEAEAADPGSAAAAGSGSGEAGAPAAAEAAARPGELVLPAHWPLIVALMGTVFHGYLLGLVAVVLSGRTRARPWLVWLTRAVGAAVALFWGVGTEMWWGPGWSTTYRGFANFLKMFFAGIGME